jgi:hypothetical protein
MNNKEYEMTRNKEALRLERINLLEAIKGLEYCLDKDNYQNGYLASWISGTPANTIARITGLLAQQNLLQEQIQEDNK